MPGWLAGLLLCANASATELAAADYARAERFLYWNQERYVVNGDVAPHWFAPQQLWFRRTASDGSTQFRVLNAATGRQRAAFDHDRIATGLSAALGREIRATALPFRYFRFTPGQRAIQAIVDARLWTCPRSGESCVGSPLDAPEPGEVASPDGKWFAYLEGHDLWVRPATGEAFPLTTDGIEHHAYAASTGNNLSPLRRQNAGARAPPILLWSPDSTMIFTHRVDERQVAELHLLQASPPDGSARPRLYTYRYSMASDEHKALVEHVLFHVPTRRRIDVNAAPVAAPFITPIELQRAWWSDDARRVFYLDEAPYAKSIALKEVTAGTGAVREILREQSDTYVRIGDIAQRPVVRTLASGDVVWYSERDGWGHLYRHDGATGRLKNRITSGEWAVRSIVTVDERAGVIFFMANGREPGRDPYLRHLYRVNLDGTHLQLLTPENAEHDVRALGEVRFQLAPDKLANPQQTAAFAPSGRYFVDTWSRQDLPPVTVVRRSDGKLAATLARASIPQLLGSGFTLPEPITALAADGETILYGTLFRPGRFAPAQRYPLIDSIYPGPQIHRAGRRFAQAAFDPFDAQALAELGFIVLAIDGRGTPMRARAFLDQSYRNLGNAGNLDDHIAVIRQLAGRYPSIDPERVGIYGQSGGGYASARAILKYPGFYKVAVSVSGNHDSRGYLAVWGETYIGPDARQEYLDATNAPLAGNLVGKLLLMHGEMDDNVHPALTLQLVDALIKANRDFDLLIVPGATHAVMNSYTRRRLWDYFVRHLLGAEPPHAYTMQSVQ